MNKDPNKCAVPGCQRYGDGDMLYRGNAVCVVHENYHQNSDGTYLWKKLGIYDEMMGKEKQVKLG